MPILAKFSGFLDLSKELASLGAELDKLAASSIIKTFLQTNLSAIIISFAMFFVVTFLFGAGVKSIKYGMILDVIKKKPLYLKSSLSHKKHYWKIVLIKLYTFILYFVLVLAASIIFLIISQPLGTTIGSIVSLILFILGNIFLYVHLYFRYACYFSSNLNAKGAMKESYDLFQRKKKLVIWTIMVVALTSIILRIPLELLLKIDIIFFDIIAAALILVVYIWSDLFVFNIHNANKIQRK